jgi:hypothetical protein
MKWNVSYVDSHIRNRTSWPEDKTVCMYSQGHTLNIPRVTCNADWGVLSYFSVPTNEFWDSTSIMWWLLPSKSFPKSSFIYLRFMRCYIFQLLTWVLVNYENESSQSNSCQRNLFYKSTFCWEDSNFCSCWIMMRISRTHLPRISNTITDHDPINTGLRYFPKCCFSNVISAISPIR